MQGTLDESPSTKSVPDAHPANQFILKRYYYSNVKNFSELASLARWSIKKVHITAQRLLVAKVHDSRLSKSSAIEIETIIDTAGLIWQK